jgi:hypothetical protein
VVLLANRQGLPGREDDLGADEVVQQQPIRSGSVSQRELASSSHTPASQAKPSCENLTTDADRGARPARDHPSMPFQLLVQLPQHRPGTDSDQLALGVIVDMPELSHIDDERFLGRSWFVELRAGAGAGARARAGRFRRRLLD